MTKARAAELRNKVIAVLCATLEDGEEALSSVLRSKNDGYVFSVEIRDEE